jgi:hypothetical protein
MEDNKTKLDDNKNNGLITKIWGPMMWESIHCIAFGYPIEPTSEQKENYKNFFLNLMNVLPCKFCRDSYKDFITKEENTLLRDEDLENRESLTKFVFKIHNRVNKKLGVNYNICYDDFVKKYESYRAKCIPNEKGCNMPLNLKADSFNMSEIKHAPLIKNHHYEGFKKYALIRGVKFDDNILKICDIKDRFDKIWQMRDKKCRQIIRKMRIEGIPSVEKDGEFKNMPTIEELHLISLLSTNICCEELDIIIDNIKKQFN